MDLNEAYALAFDVLSERVRYAAWKEEDHPRDTIGRFTDKVIAETIGKFRKLAIEDKREHQAIFDAATGEILHESIGRAFGESDKPEELCAGVSIPITLLTGDKKIEQVHTHPDDGGGPSDADWGMMGWDKIQSLRMVAKEGVYKIWHKEGRRATPRQLKESWEEIEQELEAKPDALSDIVKLLHETSEGMVKKFPQYGFSFEPFDKLEKYAADSGFITVGGHVEGDQKHVDGHVIPVDYLNKEKKDKKESKEPEKKEGPAPEPRKKGAAAARKQILIDALTPLLGWRANDAAKDIGLSIDKQRIANAIRNHLEKEDKKISYNEALKLVPPVMDKITENLKEEGVPLPHESLWKVEDEKDKIDAAGIKSNQEEQDKWKRERKEKADADKKYADEHYKKPMTPENYTSQRWVAIKIRQRMEEVGKDRAKLEKMKDLYDRFDASEIKKHDSPEAYQEYRKLTDEWDTLIAKPATRKLLNKYKYSWSDKKDNASFTEGYTNAKEIDEGLRRDWKEGEYISSYSDYAVKAKAEHLAAIQEAVKDDAKVLPDDVAEEFLYEKWLPQKYRDNATTRGFIANHDKYMEEEQDYAHGLLINALGRASPELNAIMERAGKPPESKVKKLEKEKEELRKKMVEAVDRFTEFQKAHSSTPIEGEVKEQYEKLEKEMLEADAAFWTKDTEIVKAHNAPKLGDDEVGKWLSGFFDHGGNKEITISGGDYLNDKGLTEMAKATAFLRKVVHPSWGSIIAKAVKLPDGEYRASAWENNINSNVDTADHTWVHEFGHIMEHQDGNSLGYISRAFAMQAVKDHGQKVKHLGGSYEATEIGADDGFQSSYVGKFYNHHSSEVLSMGVQYLYEDPVKFYEKSPAHFRYTIAALNKMLT